MAAVSGARLNGSHLSLQMHRTELVWATHYHSCMHNSFSYLLGIYMRIGCLTRSTWKDRNGKARSAGETMLCCPPPICSRVSERSKSLECWRASRFLSSLSCRLSSFCWAVNRLPYIWTRSVFIFYLPSPRPWSLRHRTRWHPERHVPKVRINPYIWIVNPLRTYIHTYIHTYIQAQAQTKAPLAPAAPARLWASC